MGLTDVLSDIYASLSWTEVHAEAAPEENEDQEENESEDKDDSEESSENKGEGEDGEEGEKGEGGDDEGEQKDDGEDDDDEEEEEEEEPEDIKPKLEEDCANSAQCSSFKHHFDSCVERVTAQQEDEDYKGPHEDCVEEFFHLQHCAAQCAAPKLFRQLK